MPGGVPAHDPQGVAWSATDEAQEEPCKAGRGEICEIVEARAGPAELAIALVAMADHAVQGVNGLVGEHSRQSRDDAPEERRHHAVRQVLRERFDGGAADARGVETIRVPPDDQGHLATRLG